MEASALGPVFSPVAHFLNSPELGPRAPTGATVLISCPTFMKASTPHLVPGAPHTLPCLESPTCRSQWTCQRQGTAWGP